MKCLDIKTDLIRNKKLLPVKTCLVKKKNVTFWFKDHQV